MVKLKDVIASVLRDVIEAQHEANLLTEALSEEYGENGLPKHLLVPAVNIGEMEITLKYAIINDNDDDNLETQEVIVDAKKLAELGPECIHTISFKVGGTSPNLDSIEGGEHNDNDK